MNAGEPGGKVLSRAESCYPVGPVGVGGVNPSGLRLKTQMEVASGHLGANRMGVRVGVGEALGGRLPHRVLGFEPGSGWCPF